PLMDAKYQALIVNGIDAGNAALTSSAAIKSWMSSAKDSIASQISAERNAAFAVNASVAVTNNVAYLTGTAPVRVKTVSVNGAIYPVRWIGNTTWQVAIGLKPGLNQWAIAGVDRSGQPVAGASGSASYNYGGSPPSPV